MNEVTYKGVMGIITQENKKEIKEPMLRQITLVMAMLHFMVIMYNVWVHCDSYLPLVCSQ